MLVPNTAARCSPSVSAPVPLMRVQGRLPLPSLSRAPMFTLYTPTAGATPLQRSATSLALAHVLHHCELDELEQHNTDVIDEADTELINLQKQNALLKTELVRVKSKQVRPGTSKALSSPCLSSPTFAPPPTSFILLASAHNNHCSLLVVLCSLSIGR